MEVISLSIHTGGQEVRRVRGVPGAGGDGNRVETVVPGGRGRCRGGQGVWWHRSPRCSLTQHLSGQEAQASSRPYFLPQGFVWLRLRGEHKSDRVVNELGGTCAHLSAPRHSLVNPSQRASVHTSVVPPCPRNVTGKAQADGPRAHVLACWIWKGSCLGLMTVYAPAP